MKKYYVLTTFISIIIAPPTASAATPSIAAAHRLVEEDSIQVSLMNGENDNSSSLVGGSFSQSDGAGEAKTTVAGKLNHYNNNCRYVI